MAFISQIKKAPTDKPAGAFLRLIKSDIRVLYKAADPPDGKNSDQAYAKKECPVGNRHTTWWDISCDVYHIISTVIIKTG